MSTDAKLAVKQDEQLKNPINFGTSGVQLSSFEDAYRFSKCVLNSGWAPKGFATAESVLIALQHGAELGLPPMAGLQNIAVINGRPGIYGDAALALVRSSPHCQYVKEYYTLNGKRIKDTEGRDRSPTPTELKDATCTAVCVAKRHNDPEEIVQTFSIADAQTAALQGKQGPWSQYPARMLKFRARGFALRDAFGDVLKGLKTVEEIRDIPAEARNVTHSSGLAALIEGPSDAAEPLPAEGQGDETSAGEKAT